MVSAQDVLNNKSYHRPCRKESLKQNGEFGRTRRKNNYNKIDD